MGIVSTTTRVLRKSVLDILPPDRRDQLMSLAHEVSFPAGTRLFNEGGRADRFWIIRTGTVDLDLHVPGRRAAVVESLGHGDLLGWSGLIPPHHWHLGAVADGPVRADEFDSEAVRRLCAEDPVLDHAMCTFFAGVVAQRLMASRTRLLDLYGPYGSGPAR